MIHIWIQIWRHTKFVKLQPLPWKKERWRGLGQFKMKRKRHVFNFFFPELFNTILNLVFIFEKKNWTWVYWTFYFLFVHQINEIIIKKRKKKCAWLYPRCVKAMFILHLSRIQLCSMHVELKKIFFYRDTYRCVSDTSCTGKRS